MGFLKKLFGKKEKTSEQSFQSTPEEQQQNEVAHYIDVGKFYNQYLIRMESAYRHQAIVFRRATETNRITLGEILTDLFKTDRDSIESLAVMYYQGYVTDETIEEKLLVDSEAIWNYDIFACTLKNKDEDGFYTQGMYHETTLVLKSKDQNYNLTITSLGGTYTLKYLRATIMLPDNSEQDDCCSLKTKNRPLVISFILSFNEVENNQDLEYFENIEKVILDKSESDNSLEGIEDIKDAYFHGMYEYDFYHYFGYGKYLLGQNRYLDAYVLLKRCYKHLKDNLSTGDENLMNLYYETCNMMGICLSKLDRDDEAAYYYKQASPIFTLDQPNRLALCKARLGDPSGHLLMFHWLMRVSEKYGDYGNWSEDIKQFSVDVPIALYSSKTKMEKYVSSSPSYDGSISLGYVLDGLFGIRQKNLAGCMFIFDLKNNKFLPSLNDTEVIINYPLNVEQAKDKVFVLSCTYAYYSTNEQEDKSKLCNHAPIIVSTHSVKAKDVIMRVDVMRSNFFNDDDKRQFEKINIPLNTTFCLGQSKDYSYTPNKDDLVEAINEAADLTSECRFIEAYKLSKWVFDCSSYLMKAEMGTVFENDDPLLWSIYYDSSYRVGYCLMELGKPEIAAYYLEIASKNKYCQYVQEYINCLANMKDPQALAVVNEALQLSPRPEDKEEMEMWNFHMAFLKRRKAYILIDRRELDEAERLLNEMKEDPLCKEFAEGELGYIEDLKNQAQ